MLLWFLVILIGFLLYGGTAVIALLVTYHIISTAKTLKQNSKQQTELLQEIKGLLEEVVKREESDDVT